MNYRQEDHEGVYVMDVGVTALHLAAGRGHLAVVKALIAGGANVNMMSYRPNGEHNSGALYIASIWGHLQVAKTLLAAGADVRQRDSDGGTSLHAAVNDFYVDIADMLLKAGVDPNACDNDGRTPMDFAEKDRETVRLLEKYGGRHS